MRRVRENINVAVIEWTYMSFVRKLSSTIPYQYKVMDLGTVYMQLFLFSWIPVFGSESAMPVIVEESRSSISLGSCTWIIYRKCPDDDVQFYLYTRQNPNDRQFVHIDETWEKSNLSTSYFNPYHPVKVIIHGYNSDMFLNSLIQMKDEYLQRGNYNLFYVNWSKLSPSPCYISAVHNTRHVGVCIAQLIERVLESGTANIHLIGFSLGAHVPNFVARSLPSFVIPRITGLDPAMPLFITASANEKLDPSDAAFVDIIHTNAFIQGKIERCGHVDFYMNGGIVQPGCFSRNDNPFACSHQRAPNYFTESIRSYKGFWGWGCSSYINYLLGLCTPTNYLVLAGEDCRTDSSGMFLVTTNDQPPFALGKWTDINTDPPQVKQPLTTTPYTTTDPLQKQIDHWGKLEGNFNNIMNFPSTFGPEPNGANWPYFNYEGTNEITNQNYLNSTKVRDVNVLKKFIRKPVNISQINNNQHSTNMEVYRKQLIETYKTNLPHGLANSDILEVPKLEEH